MSSVVYTISTPRRPLFCAVQYMHACMMHGLSRPDVREMHARPPYVQQWPGRAGRSIEKPAARARANTQMEPRTTQTDQVAGRPDDRYFLVTIDRLQIIDIDGWNYS